ncbi:porin [Paraburkholderia solisilvae]|uniref:Outer membrane porin protein n=1 Tax=Paraburkholderia solisilvae TaxID=624376 RepID=A0A6J5DK22_9BURK|nr:porin [Paraburkholderia solisilvae]CAB3753581.1 Outer membrane porin protein [Paraburkholderia solisilvae]
MVKIRYIAAACAMVAAGAAHAQSSVTLFGLIDTGIVYQNNARVTPGSATSPGASSWSMQSGNIFTSRWGLRGTEDLGGGLSAVFWLENGFNVDNGTLKNGGDLFGRQAWVGLHSNQYGTVTLGRQYDFMVDFVAPMSATGSGFGGNLASHVFDNDNLNNDMRLNNSIKFSSVSYDGIKVGAMYAFSGEAGNFSNNGAYSLGASYAYGPFKLGAAYLQINRTAQPDLANATGAVSTGDGDELTTGGSQQIFGAGAQYSFGASTIGAVWTHSVTYNITGVFQDGSTSTGALAGESMKFDNFELNGRYFVRPDFSLGASYTYTTGQFSGASKGFTSASPHWNQIMAQADYFLSPRTDIYIEGVYQKVSGGNGNGAFDASIFTLDPAAGDEQVAVAIGMKHRF